MLNGSPKGRHGHDTDMGACILYLAGPGGVFLNGQVIYPDGGEKGESAGSGNLDALTPSQAISLSSQQQRRQARLL